MTVRVDRVAEDLDLNYETVRHYLDVMTDDDGDVVADFDVSLSGATVSTAFAVGSLTPDDEPDDEALDLQVAQDASCCGTRRQILLFRTLSRADSPAAHAGGSGSTCAPS